jgi:DNA repair exonuclease SbcCD ATPase subunit
MGRAVAVACGAWLAFAAVVWGAPATNAVSAAPAKDELAALKGRIAELEDQRRALAAEQAATREQALKAKHRALSENPEIKAVFEEIQRLNQKLAGLLKTDKEYVRLDELSGKLLGDQIAAQRKLDALRKELESKEKPALGSAGAGGASAQGQ